MLAAFAATGCAHKLAFPKTALTDARTGTEYSAKLDVGQCDPRIGSASVESGKLPPGLGLSFSGEQEARNLVLIQGVPRVPGTYKFTLGATCKGDDENKVTKGRYTLKVVKSGDPAGLHLDEKNPPNAQVGAPYEHKITIGKCEGDFKDVDVPKGKLPAGLTVAAGADELGHLVVLKGKAKKAGTYKFTLQATCGSPPHSLDPGAQITRDYTIVVK